MGKLVQDYPPIKAIIAASSGAGKTGALYSLAEAGFKLKIYDCDRGSNILGSLLRDSKAIDNVEVNHFSNRLKATKDAGYAKPDGSPTAWPNFLNALNKWPDGGSVLEWGPDTVVVIDSLTLLGRHALLWAQHKNNRADQKAQWTDFGDAQAQLESMIAMLYGDNIKCHVLYLTHIKVERDADGNFMGAFPSSIGKALNEVIPRYVNNILTIKMTGLGTKAKRYLSTQPTTNQISTKTEELHVKKEYLLADGTDPKPGLAEFFADCGWASPKGAS